MSNLKSCTSKTRFPSCHYVHAWISPSDVEFETRLSLQTKSRLALAPSLTRVRTTQLDNESQIHPSEFR